jgi:hypothetical protein
MRGCRVDLDKTAETKHRITLGSPTSAKLNEPGYNPPREFERGMHMAVKRDFFAAQSLFELVNRRIVNPIDAFKIIARASAPNGPFDDTPLTRLTNTVAEHVPIRSAPDLVHVSSHPYDEETRGKHVTL